LPVVFIRELSSTYGTVRLLPTANAFNGSRSVSPVGVNSLVARGGMVGEQFCHQTLPFSMPAQGERQTGPICLPKQAPIDRFILSRTRTSGNSLGKLRSGEDRARVFFLLQPALKNVALPRTDRSYQRGVIQAAVASTKSEVLLIHRPNVFAHAPPCRRPIEQIAQCRRAKKLVAS